MDGSDFLDYCLRALMELDDGDSPNVQLNTKVSPLMGAMIETVFKSSSRIKGLQRHLGGTGKVKAYTMANVGRELWAGWLKAEMEDLTEEDRTEVWKSVRRRMTPTWQKFVDDINAKGLGEIPKDMVEEYIADLVPIAIHGGTNTLRAAAQTLIDSLEKQP